MLRVRKAHVQGSGRQVRVRGPQCLERASGEVRVTFKRRGGRVRASLLQAEVIGHLVALGHSAL
jgi:hypothetical protein